MFSKTFPAELIAAGVSDLAFSWTEDGTFLFGDTVTPEQRATILAVGAANKPDPKEPIREGISRLLSTAGVEQVWQLDAGLASVLSLGMQQGLTEPQIYAINPGYRQIKDLRAVVAIEEAKL